MAFTICINDLCQSIKYAKPSLFADDFKMVEDVSSPVSREFLQQDVDAVARWSVVNKLTISYEKSMTLHFGNGNLRTQYVMNGKVIGSGNGCMDLIVYRSDTASYEPCARSVALKASRLASMVLKIFSTREPDFLKCLFVAYVKPTLEYAVAVWSPASVAARDLIERVQRRYTKRIRGYTDMSHFKRLEMLQLESLKNRRLYHDMLLTFKCLHQRAMMRLDLNYVLPLRELGVSDWSAFAQGLRLYLQPFYAELLENGMSCLTVW